MTDRVEMSGSHDCCGDAAAYALGALEPEEAEAFRAHMGQCAVCRDELESLGGVVQALPLTTRQYAAPLTLRRRVMRELRRQREPRPVAARLRLGSRLGSVRARVLAGAGALTVAAAAAVAAVELSAPTAATLIPARLWGISGSAQLRLAGGHAELVVHHLTPPGRGRIYEVWLQFGSAAPVPASVLFGVNSAGDADVGIPARMRGVNAVLVTPEPLGGSPSPTHAPVIVARLA